MQQSTISVSKGVFVFKNGNRPAKPAAKKSRRSGAAAAPTPATSLLTSEYKSQRWYAAFSRTWSRLQSAHDALQTTGYSHTLAYLQQFVQQSAQRRAQLAAADDTDDDPNLPTTALLTGINQPDHEHLFRSFADAVRREMRSHVCILHSQDCPQMKSAIEAMVSGFMQAEDVGRRDGGAGMDVDGEDEAEEEEEEEPSEVRRMRRSQYTMAVLKAWYEQKYPLGAGKRPILAIIIPDFENFHRDVLQQFILLLSHNCRRLPLVLVLGVATDLATLHRTLSFADTSRMSLQVSQSQPSTHTLSRILDEIVLTPFCPLQLSAKVFTLLTDIFLYYDLSISSFMQGFKYCVMEHYGQGNAYAICAGTAAEVRHAVKHLHVDDLEAIRRLPSFRRYVESLIDCRHVIAVLTDAEALRGQLHGMLEDVRVWLRLWHAALRVLLQLVAELPRTQLGKQLRDLYAKCAASMVTESAEFAASWELLGLLAREELVAVLRRTVDGLRVAAERYGPGESGSAAGSVDAAGKRAAHAILGVARKLEAHVERIVVAGLGGKSASTTERNSPEQDAASSATSATDSAATVGGQSKVLSRHEMQARLLEMSKQPKTANEFTLAVRDALAYLRDSVLAKHLRPFSRGPPMLELFVFADVGAVRPHIMGAPRATLHTALNNPQCYLQCDCCVLQNGAQMTASLPDLSVVYKLHLESGRMINVFDWMQAFRAVVEPIGDDAEEEEAAEAPISPQLQARFTRAVAELQFLGFIKSSKRKTDHVARLTW